MTDNLPSRYLTLNQALEKYTFITKGMLRHWLYSNMMGFRSSVAKKIGKRIFLDEDAFLRFLRDNPAE